jgi:hypothetical protein
MKKFIAIFLLFLMTILAAQADTRYYTTRSGVRTMYGYIRTNPYSAVTSCDPFSIEINGKKYFLITDRGNKNFTYQSLLGCDGSMKRTITQPLEFLDSDGNGERLSTEELRRAGIRFVRLKPNGKLAVYDKKTDYNLDNIGYIDLRRVRFSTTGNAHGNYDVYVKRSSGSLRKVIGHVHSISLHSVKRMF